MSCRTLFHPFAHDSSPAYRRNSLSADLPTMKEARSDVRSYLEFEFEHDKKQC